MRCGGYNGRNRNISYSGWRNMCCCQRCYEFGDDKENVENSAKAELTQAQLDMVKHQVDEVIKQQISGLSEKRKLHLIRYLTPRFLK